MAEDMQNQQVQDQVPISDPPSKKLWQMLHDNQAYTNSYDDFVKKYSDPKSQQNLYNVLNKSEAYTNSFDDFTNKYFTTSSQRPSSYPINTGFSVNPNLGAPRQPLSVNLHPDQPQQPQQQEAPSVDNNFGINHNQLAAGQQSQSDNTANVAPQQALNKVDFDVNHAKREQEKQNYTNQAIDNATAKALKLKGINAQPGSVQYNQQRNEFVKQVQNGDATVNTKNGEAGLERTTGFWHNIVSGFNEATTGADEANDFVNNMTTKQMVDYVNRKQSQQPSPYIGERPNLLGSAGHFLGSSAPTLEKGVAGAVIGAGTIAAAPESMGASLAGLPTALSIAFSSGDMANQGAQQAIMRSYQILKQQHPERSDEQNMEEAKKAGLTGFISGFGQNVALMGTGLKTPVMAESKSLLGQTIHNIVNSGAHLGAVTAGATAAEQEINNLQGIPTSQMNILKNSLKAGLEGATTGSLLAAYMHVPEMPKILKSMFKDAIVRNSDPQTVANVLQANENAGNIPPGTTQAVTADLKGYSDALNKIPDGLSPEAQSSIAGLIQKKNNLIAESKTKDDSFKDFYQNQIDPINQQISDIQRTGKPFEHEIDEATGKPYEQPTYDDVAKQNVQDLAKKISKNADISDPHSIQTQQNFPEQLKAELQNIADVEKKNNEGKENPNTEVADNAENYIKKNLTVNEQKNDNPIQNDVKPAPDNVSRETGVLNNEPKLAVEPPKPITEMNSEEMYDYATQVKKELRRQDKEFENKTEAEKEAGGYYDVIDNVEDLRDASTKINYIENAEGLDDLASSVRAAVSNIRNKPTEYDLAILNAAKKKAAELNIPTEDLIKEVVKQEGNRHRDANDAAFMMKNVLEKLIQGEPNTETPPEINKPISVNEGEQRVDFNSKEYKDEVTQKIEQAKKPENKEKVAVLANGLYQRAIDDGRMRATDAKTIIESAGLKVPKDILGKANEENRTTPKGTNSPISEVKGEQKGQGNKETVSVGSEPVSGGMPKEGDIVDFGEGKEKVTRIVDTPKGEMIEAVNQENGSDRRNLYTPKDYQKALDNKDKYAQQREDRIASEKEYEKSLAAKEEKEKSDKAAYENTYGFADKENPMKRGKILSYLNKEVEGKGVVKDYLKDLVENKEAHIRDFRGKPTLMYNDGKHEMIASNEYQTKLARDYIAHLKSLPEEAFEKANENKSETSSTAKESSLLDDPDAKINKSEERIAKEQIKKKDADKILQDGGLTLENLEQYKHLLSSEEYKAVKNSLNENERPTTESAADGQPNTGNDGNKETGKDSDAQAEPQTEHSRTSAEVPEPITKSETGGTGTAEQGTSVSKVAFARSNSYDAYKILHPDESVEDYNKVRNSDVEIPTGDLRKLSKEYAKQKSQEAFNSKVDNIADKIISKISFKGAEGAKKAGVGDEEIIRTAAKIIKAAYSAKENIREAVEKAIDYIKEHLFVDKESEDNIRDQFNGVAAQFEKARHLTKVTDMVRDGKTDEQIIDHLSRKGVPRESALAILGDAKTNQVTPEEKAEALDQATKKYNKIEDEWLGEKSLTLVNSRVIAKDQQDAIKKSNDTTDLKAKIKSILDGEGTAKERTTAAQKLINALHAAKDWRNIDKAIHIYLDLKRNPDHYEEYYNKLTPQQKAIADLSKNLNTEQLKIADEISKEYDEIGKMATDQGLIKEALDNYVSRAWDFGKNSNESGFKFTTSTRHSLERSLDTILQGQAEGLKLKLEGATNNLQTLKVELGNVIENKKLIDKGFQTKVDTGLKDENGKPITESYFSVEPRKGYAKIENPFFKKWTYVGKAGEGTEANGKNIKVVGDAILEKKDIYAPESAAKSINNILGKSKFDALGFTKFARFVKQSILSLSGFHYIAFTRAHLLSGKFTELKGISPRKAYKDGLSQLHSLSPEAGELIKGGLTIGRQQDWTEGLSAYNIEPKTQLGKMVNQFHKHLFETYGAGLKTFDAVNLYRSELIKNAKREKPLTREQVAANVSKLMNDTYGGENFQKMRGTFLQNPTNRHLLSLGLLAPDWTISNLRQVRNAFVGNSTKMYRNMWFRILTRGAAVTLGANALMTLMDDKDKDGNQLPYWDAFEQRYQKSFDAGRLKSLMVDMTPLYHLAGGDKNQRAYFSIFGAYTDPLKLVNNPVQFLENKTSPTTVKIPLELLTGENWQQKRFTDVDELLGIDDKGTYSKTIHAHKMGDISTTTGKAYVRDQKGHEAGENKGGKLRGQLVKYDDKDHGPVSFEELPSFTLSQVRGMMPTALQSIYQGISGENDWAKTMFQAPGTGVMFGKEGAQDKEKTLFNLGKKIYDKVTK